VIVVAVIPAKDRAGSVAATVAATRGIAGVGRVIVVDDGSTDETAARAEAAGAEVVRLAQNVGKGGAVAAGLARADEADVVLLLDSDLGPTAAAAAAILGPVLAGDVDATVAVLPSAGGRGGFGFVRDLAAAGIEEATGWRPRAPLSGQRAVRADRLRPLVLAPRFALEVAMTIDLLRAGAAIREVDAAMDHEHTGRSLAGFRHRAGQGLDVVRALGPRLGARRTVRVAGRALRHKLLP
jgi:glycosyltransferase involved in cell wall biosynthesis